MFHLSDLLLLVCSSWEASCVNTSFDVLAAYLDGSNTLGHLTGYILTSPPLTKGGLSPYDVVPTCFLQSADHLFHDEVHFMLEACTRTMLSQAGISCRPLIFTEPNSLS